MIVLIAVGFFVAFTVAIGAALAAPTVARVWRRRRITRRPFPAAWRNILRRRVPLVRELPAAQQLLLKKRIKELRAEGLGILKIAKQAGCGVSVVQRVLSARQRL